jgi:hypothetical protein
MSQEILFLLFMLFELAAILSLYQFVIIPRIALKTNNLFEERMLDKTWDIPAMLEDYTKHLTGVFAVLIKELVPSIIGGHMTAGTKQLRADPENILMTTTADFLDELPPSARLVANMVLPRIQEALAKAGTGPDEASVSYNPGLNRR